MRSFKTTAWVALACACLASCVDVRDFTGRWTGAPANTSPGLLSGFPLDDQATLTLDLVEAERVHGVLSTATGIFQETLIEPLPAAEADVLGKLSFAGSPLRVFVSFAAAADAAGDALVLTALYPEDRIELRVLRGRPSPLYGIFDLRRENP